MKYMNNAIWCYHVLQYHSTYKNPRRYNNTGDLQVHYF